MVYGKPNGKYSTFFYVFDVYRITKSSGSRALSLVRLLATHRLLFHRLAVHKWPISHAALKGNIKSSYDDRQNASVRPSHKQHLEDGRGEGSNKRPKIDRVAERDRDERDREYDRGYDRSIAMSMFDAISALSWAEFCSRIQTGAIVLSTTFWSCRNSRYWQCLSKSVSYSQV